jgi:hypothetical protein
LSKVFLEIKEEILLLGTNMKENIKHQDKNGSFQSVNPQ